MQDTEKYLGSCQASVTESFAKTVKGSLLPILEKRLIRDI